MPADREGLSKERRRRCVGKKGGKERSARRVMGTAKTDEQVKRLKGRAHGKVLERTREKPIKGLKRSRAVRREYKANRKSVPKGGTGATSREKVVKKAAARAVEKTILSGRSGRYQRQKKRVPRGGNFWGDRRVFEGGA